MQKRAAPFLLGIAVCSIAVLCWLLLRLGRSAAEERGPSVALAAKPDAGAPSGSVPIPETSSADLRVPRAAPELEAPTPPPAWNAPTVVRGRVALDGAPLEGGWLSLRALDETWQGRAALDFEGRFHLAGVPVTPLAVVLELHPEQALAQRRTLLLPTPTVTPAAAPDTELDLDWASKQINVRVLDAAMEGLAARLAIEGPDYGTGATVETELDGTARLTLVGEGLFHFRAETRDGRRGEAALELAGGADLDSAVIVVR